MLNICEDLAVLKRNMIDHSIKFKYDNDSICVLSNKNIKAGDLLITESPFFIIDENPRVSPTISEYLYTFDGKSLLDILSNCSLNITDFIFSNDIILGMFYTLSRMKHSCSPNTYAIWNYTTSLMECYALKDINIDEELTVSHVNILMCKSKRHELLNRICTCKRCENNNDELFCELNDKISIYFQQKNYDKMICAGNELLLQDIPNYKKVEISYEMYNCCEDNELKIYYITKCYQLSTIIYGKNHRISQILLTKIR
jgi:hypothetical protein